MITRSADLADDAIMSHKLMVERFKQIYRHRDSVDVCDDEFSMDVFGDIDIEHKILTKLD